MTPKSLGSMLSGGGKRLASHVREKTAIEGSYSRVVSLLGSLGFTWHGCIGFSRSHLLKHGKGIA
jgi:hypothetical protein